MVNCCGVECAGGCAVANACGCGNWTVGMACGGTSCGVGVVGSDGGVV